MRGEVTVPLAVRDLTLDDLDSCAWSGGALHLVSVAAELRRAEAGEVDYLAVCPTSGTPVAIGGVDFAPLPGAGYLWQLAVHPALQRCGIGTLLVAGLEDRIRRRGLARAELRYEADNPGNGAFYTRLAYTPYGTALDGWEQQLPNGDIEWYSTTCVKMRRKLD